MKTLLTILFATSLSLCATAQVLCIKCYDQNARVLTYTNDLILNGGFEHTTCLPGDSSFCPNSRYYGCDISNWTCTGGGLFIHAIIADTTYSIIPEGHYAALWLDVYAYTCSNTYDDTTCLHKTGCQVTGIPSGFPQNWDTTHFGATGVSLSQTVSGLTPGAVYSLEFWAGGWMSYGNKGLFAVDIGFGNIFLRNPSTDPIDYPWQTTGTRYVIVFTANSPSHTIKFTNWGYINSTHKGPELALDDVRLFAETEGSTICSTSSEDISKNSSTLFPNPATNLLIITTYTTHLAEIIFYDITSRKMMQEKFSKEISLDISRLARGIYFYQIKTEDGMVSNGKVVKE